MSITSGVVSRIEVTTYTQSTTDLLGVQIDAAINSGNSGGPSFNSRGECVGIAFQSLRVSTPVGTSPASACTARKHASMHMYQPAQMQAASKVHVHGVSEALYHGWYCLTHGPGVNCNVKTAPTRVDAKPMATLNHESKSAGYRASLWIAHILIRPMHVDSHALSDGGQSSVEACAGRGRREYRLHHSAARHPALHYRLRAQRSVHRLPHLGHRMAEAGKPLPAQGPRHEGRPLLCICMLRSHACCHCEQVSLATWYIHQAGKHGALMTL